MKNLKSIVLIALCAITILSAHAQITEFTSTALSVSSDNYSGGAGQGVQIVGFNTNDNVTVGVTPLQIIPFYAGSLGCILDGGSLGGGYGIRGGTTGARLLGSLPAFSSATVIVYPYFSTYTNTYSIRTFASGGTFINVSARVWVTGVPYTSVAYTGSSPTLSFTLAKTCTVQVQVLTTSLSAYGLTALPSAITSLSTHGESQIILNEGSLVITLEPGTYSLFTQANGQISGEALVQVTVIGE